MDRRFVVALAFALAACGAPSTSSTASPDTSAAATATTAVGLTPEQITSAVAALPAPYNAGDYDAGKRVFAQCRSCHTIDASDANRMGPHLHGVVGRHAASVQGFSYSPALQHADFNWDADHLDQWTKNPQALVAGNRMAFAGVRDDTQRRDLLTYLMVESGR